MKFFKRTILSIILLSTFFCNYSYAESAKVNIEATRMREEKNTTSKILTVIYKGDEVEILEEQEEWYKIKYKEYTGFVKKEYLNKNNSSNNQEKTENKPNETIIEEPLKENEVYIEENINLKLMPSFMSKNIDTLEKGKKVEILSELNNWIKISDGTIQGWIIKTKTTTKNVEETVESKQETNTVANTVSNTESNTAKENLVNSNKVSENKIKENKISENVVTENVTSENTTTIDRTGSLETRKKGIVIVETAKVRSKATTSSKTLGFLDYGDEISINSEEGEWYKITFENKEAYVNSELIKIEGTTSRSLTEERKEHIIEEDISTKVDEKIENVGKVEEQTTNSVVEFASKYLGYPYVLGGKTPDTGFDCSGFTRYVYKNFGYNLASVAAEQNQIGDEIKREDLQQGDLILFLNEENTKIGHTGIYIGNGEFIHAANPKRGVVIDNLNTNSYYNERFVTARRIVK